ncbi:MAG: PilT/PilU family type 4a pilus ATPase [bacterium]|nr:PilT/PilU family type 4a pilus ATPase [bacterium]
MLWEGPENRRSTRIRSKIFVRYHRLIDSSMPLEYRKSFIRNINAFGLLLEADEVLPIGSEIKLLFTLPGLGKEIMAIGRVVHLEELDFNTRYQVGVAFQKLEGVDQEEIKKRIEMMDILHLLHLAHENKASDLHLTYGRPPILRVFGRLQPLDMEELGSEELQTLIYSILTEEQIRRFEKWKELDFAFSPNPHIRFRVNVHLQRGNVEAVFRTIRPDIRSIAELGLPSVVADLAEKRKGIVIIAGPTGSGKTTTLAAMVDKINREREAVIICLENPIECLHTNIKSIVKQREIGTDTISFSTALRYALRQDPDVILIGELQDAESASVAITAAETGHLVLTSMHAPDCVQVLDRLIGMFPSHQRNQISMQLSNCLLGIVAQALLPRKSGEDRVVATEALIVTEAARSIIRENNTVQLRSIIETGGRYKMHTMQDSVRKLYNRGIISLEVAKEFCTDLDMLAEYATDKVNH